MLRFVNEPVQDSWPTVPLLKDGQTIADVRDSIEKLRNLGAIRTCTPVAGQFLSSYFLVPKSDGSFRFVLNLKKLNKFICTSHFKMEDGRTAEKLMSQGDFLANIDLENAYFLIPIHETSSKYLRFYFEGQIFEFLCLPFGLNIAPWLFTKIMKPVVNLLRRKGFRSVIYLDDFLCLGSSEELCQSNVEETIKLLEVLGFVINYKKSSLVPKQKCEFLGIIYDSLSMTRKLPERKVQKALELLDQFGHKKVTVIRNWASFVGFLNFCAQAVEYGRLYLRNFERVTYQGLLSNNNNFEARIVLSQELQADFEWWKRNVAEAKSAIRQPQFVREIFSDASPTGWGAACKEEKARGRWKESEEGYHINYLELVAAFMALKSFASDLLNCEVLMRIDNTTAISYINRMGGVQYTHLDNIAQEIWKWCEARGLWIFASYIRSKDNVDADFESRVKNIDSEWSLAGFAFDKIVDKFGYPSIDIFASRANAKCESYFAWHRDPEAMAIDAFTQDWSGEFFYAFPPFSLILRVLQKIRSDKASGILVVPNWPNQPWFPLFMESLISKELIFNPSNSLLLSPCRTIHHPLARSLTLIAGHVSGRAS